MDQTSDFLAKNIASLRQAKAWTQKDLAIAASIPRTTISHIESGSGNPSLNSLLKISQALHIGIEELISKPKAYAEKFKKEELETEFKGDKLSVVTKLIPHRIQGLDFEKMEFSPGAHMKGSPHLKGSHEYFYCVKGHMKIYVSGEAYELRAGELLYFPGDQSHAYINQLKSKSLGISLINVR